MIATPAVLGRVLSTIIALLLLAAPAPIAAQKRIALTFDDVPRGRGPFFTPDERSRRILAALKAGNVKQAAFYVVPSQIGHGDGLGGERRISAYVAAGHVVANHSFTHPHLSELTIAQYLADVDRAEAWLKPRPGYRPWFRYPFLDEGQDDKVKRDSVRVALWARGLGNGYATVDGNDWHVESLAAEAVRAGKTFDRRALGRFYVDTMVGAADFADRLALKTWGRQPAQVIVLHETDMAALYLVDLIRGLRRDGWTIVSVDEAYADPIARLRPPDVPNANGTLTELAAWEKGIPAPRWYERNNEALMARLFARQVLHETTPATKRAKP